MLFGKLRTVHRNIDMTCKCVGNEALNATVIQWHDLKERDSLFTWICVVSCLGDKELEVKKNRLVFCFLLHLNSNLPAFHLSRK